MANQCVSFRQFCGMLGYSLNSGSATTAVKECTEKYNLDCSHFTGQGWCKNNFDISKFVKGKKMNGTARILAFYRGWKCEYCGNTEWNRMEW